MKNTQILNERGISPGLRMALYELFTQGHKKKEEMVTLQFLNSDDRKELDKYFHRRFAKSTETRRALNEKGKRVLRDLFFEEVKKRGPLKEEVRRFRPLMYLFDDFMSDFDAITIRRFANKNKIDLMEARIKAGQKLATYEKHIIEMANERIEALRRQKKVPLYLELPLFACSGELEADQMKVGKVSKIARNKGANHRVTYAWKFNDKLDFGVDGGGQAETRFLIEGSLPDLVCNCVEKIGEARRNGGHIHINVQNNETIAETVFLSFRYHLSWFRWLVPAVRRHHRWCNIDSTPDNWRSARNEKACAISGNSYYRTGTVEIRLWPTSDKATEWRGRAALMQAMAKWGVERAFNGVFQINKSVGEAAWTEFFCWAAKKHPEGLRYALRTLRRKMRSCTEEVDRVECGRLYQLFLDSGVTVAGFRRRSEDSQKKEEVITLTQDAINTPNF